MDLSLKNCYLIVRGPSKLLAEGYFEINGAYMQKCECVVPIGKSAIMKIDEATIQLSENASYEVLDKSPIPKEWEDIAEVANDYEKIMILGGVDTGKTTLATYLANKLESTYILDADVGQKEVGIPASLSLAKKEDNIIFLHELKPLLSYFIGDISPEGKIFECVFGAWKLAEKSKGRTIINTTGLIDKEGIKLKKFKILALKPDLIICIERKNELEYIQKFFGEKIKIIRIKVPNKAKEVTREQRKFLRCRSYANYFSNAEILTVDGISEKIVSDFIFIGKKVDVSTGVYAELLGDLGIIVTNNFVNRDDIAKKLGVAKIRIVSHEIFKDIIIAFLDEEGYAIDFGILKELNFKKDEAKILTPLKKKKFDKIELGKIKINENFNERRLMEVSI